MKLTGLIRLAKREPKFNFIGRRGDAANPFYRGFDNRDKDEVQEYDQPVIVRLDPSDANELRGGFPKTPEELFDFHAVILDDVESEFFTQDQMLLLKDFVRQRGGGLLMLGGQESFKNGRYDRTPLGDLMPVYADEVPAPPPDALPASLLTREGMLEPWVRLRGDEDAERQSASRRCRRSRCSTRCAGSSPARRCWRRRRPRAARRRCRRWSSSSFGQGRAAALLVGDLWRWSLRRPDDANGKAEDDLGKAWRQIVLDGGGGAAAGGLHRRRRQRFRRARRHAAHRRARRAARRTRRWTTRRSPSASPGPTERPSNCAASRASGRRGCTRRSTSRGSPARTAPR